MMLLLSSFVASLDGLIIGISLKFLHQTLSKKNIITLFLGNLVIYTIILSCYYFFQFQFITSFISTLLYLFLAFQSLKEHGEMVIHQELCFTTCILLTLSHSIDGVLVSLGFVYEYSLWLIIFLFSFMAVLLMIIGNYSAKFFKYRKKSNYFSFVLFLLLAFFNQFL